MSVKNYDSIDFVWQIVTLVKKNKKNKNYCFRKIISLSPKQTVTLAPHHENVCGRIPEAVTKLCACFE